MYCLLFVPLALFRLYFAQFFNIRPRPGLSVVLPLHRTPSHRNELLLYVTQQCLRAVNWLSGPDFGRTAPGKAPTSVLRPAFRRPKGQFRCFPSSSPATLRPGRPISGPEAPLRNIEYNQRSSSFKANEGVQYFWGPKAPIGPY